MIPANMKQYKFSFEVNLSNPTGGACTSPLAIMMQMEAARGRAQQKIRDFLKPDQKAAQCHGVEFIPGQIAFIMTCTPALAREFACVRGIGLMGEYKETHSARQNHAPFDFKS